MAEVDGYKAKSSIKAIERNFYIEMLLLSTCWIEMADSKEEVKIIRVAL